MQELRDRALSSADDELEAAKQRMEERKYRLGAWSSSLDAKLCVCASALGVTCASPESGMSLCGSFACSRQTMSVQDSPRLGPQQLASAKRSVSTAVAQPQQRFSFPDKSNSDEDNEDAAPVVDVDAALSMGECMLVGQSGACKKLPRILENATVNGDKL